MTFPLMINGLLSQDQGNFGENVQFVREEAKVELHIFRNDTSWMDNERRGKTARKLGQASWLQSPNLENDNGFNLNTQTDFFQLCTLKKLEI